MRTAGLLDMNDATDRVLRCLIELSVAHCLASGDGGAPAPGGAAAPGRELSFLAIDPLVRLLGVLTASQGGGEAFLSRVLLVLSALVRRDADDRAGSFNSRPYLRLLVGLASELGPGGGGGWPGGPDAPNSPGPVAEGVGLRYMRLLGSCLLSLQPLSVPSFAFAYLEAIAHRAFMPKLLLAPQQAGWPLFEALLVALLVFLEPALRGADLSDGLRCLYKGGLRLLLVLLHDFPEFLCEHHAPLCDAIPPSAIQMRNLILSAFPRNMRLPDPFTPNLKVDQLLPEIGLPPRGLPPQERLLPPGLRAQLDSFLASRQPGGLPAGLARALLVPEAALKAAAAARAAGGGPPSRYNVPLMHALVLYLGGAAAAGQPLAPGAPALALLGQLAAALDAEGRYLLLNAVANQLRYPNSHTHYFSCVLLALFREGGEALQEQVTRVLLERLIVNRPHPWGLLITFIELIKNPAYAFWNHNFTRCAPEIERLFDSVARSCMAGKPDGAPGGGGEQQGQQQQQQQQPGDVAMALAAAGAGK
jgi:CCR4-NOT transcription complex subunit 1